MGEGFSLCYMADRISNWFERRENFVSWSIAFLMDYVPSHAYIIKPSKTLCFLRCFPLLTMHGIFPRVCSCMRPDILGGLRLCTVLLLLFLHTVHFLLSVLLCPNYFFISCHSPPFLLLLLLIIQCTSLMCCFCCGRVPMCCLWGYGGRTLSVFMFLYTLLWWCLAPLYYWELYFTGVVHYYLPLSL